MGWILGFVNIKLDKIVVHSEFTRSKFIFLLMDRRFVVRN